VLEAPIREVDGPLDQAHLDAAFALLLWSCCWATAIRGASILHGIAHGKAIPRSAADRQGR
jgi:hypothetical protein